jgi:hypothetical protein
MIHGADATEVSGRTTLDVVGESHYQDALWRIVGGFRQESVRHDVHAVLVTEEDNPYDPNAIAVWIDGAKIGYLSREDARRYHPGLVALERKLGTPIGLRGTIVGGGPRDDGIGMLGVFLDHDPAAFGIRPSPPAANTHLRTGRSEVDGLGWFTDVSSNDTDAIKQLRRLLASESEPLDRHFMYDELAQRLYGSRDAFASALGEFDEACEHHHDEMSSIRPALMNEFGGIPLLRMYRQMCIREQKASNWESVVDWARRGIAIYGDDALEGEWVSDLQARLTKADNRLRPRTAAPRASKVASSPEHARTRTTELLLCRVCGAEFEHTVTRGRKPTTCSACQHPQQPRRDVSDGRSAEEREDCSNPPLITDDSGAPAASIDGRAQPEGLSHDGPQLPGVGGWEPPHVPAAWQPDPLGRHEFRYWNGATWTEHVADAGVAGVDPP